MSKNVPNPTQNDPEMTSPDLEELLGLLSLDEIRFLIARSETTTDKDAAIAIGYSPRTVIGWPADRKELIRQALRYMAQDGLVTALHLRRRNLAKAMAKKVAGLDNGDERIVQSVATEVIEWELGKATQKQESQVSVAGGVTIYLPDNGRGDGRAEG